MKKIFISVFLLCVFTFINAQDYQKLLAGNLKKLNTAKTTEEYDVLKNNFATLTGVEGTDWRANYYAALSLIKGELLLNRNGDTHGSRFIAASAEKYLSPVLASQQNNQNVSILLNFIEFLKNKDDLQNIPNSRILKYAVSSEEDNSQILLLKGLYELQKKNKLEAVKYFQNAKNNINNSEENNWSIEEINYYLSVLSN